MVRAAGLQVHPNSCRGRHWKIGSERRMGTRWTEGLQYDFAPNLRALRIPFLLDRELPALQLNSAGSSAPCATGSGPPRRLPEPAESCPRRCALLHLAERREAALNIRGRRDLYPQAAHTTRQGRAVLRLPLAPAQETGAARRSRPARLLEFAAR